MADTHLHEAYEYDVTHSPYNVNNWTAYLDFISSDPFLPTRQALYHRAVTKLPRSYKLWYKYLSEYITHVKILPLTDPTWATVSTLCEKSLIFLQKMPLLWSLYLNFLLLQPYRITSTRLAFNKALQQLPVTLHLEHIWPIYLEFAQLCPSKQTSVSIWQRYLIISPESREDYITTLLSAQNWDQAAIEYNTILSNSNFRSLKGKSKFELWTAFLTLLVNHSTSIRSIIPEDVIRRGLLMYPQESAILWCFLAKMFIQRGFMSKARDVYIEALNTLVTLKDFSTVYESYMEFEYALAGTIDEVITMKNREVEILQSYVNEYEAFKLGQIATDQELVSLSAGDVISNLPSTQSTAVTTTEVLKVEPKKKKKSGKKMKFGTYTNEIDLLRDFNALLHEIRLLEAEYDLAEVRIQFYSSCRDLYINNTLLRQNPHNINEWFVRLKLFAQDKVKCVEIYKEALETVDPTQVIGRYHDLWISFANFYLDNNQIDDARGVYERGIIQLQQSEEAMVYLWCKYAEMELMQIERPLILLRNEKDAIEGQIQIEIQRMEEREQKRGKKQTAQDQILSITTPKTPSSLLISMNTKRTQLEDQINALEKGNSSRYEACVRAKNILQRATMIRITEYQYLLHTKGISLKQQQKSQKLYKQLNSLTKSLQIWSFLVDLTECICAFQYTKNVYKNLISMKIHTPSILIQYCQLLLEHNCHEEAFSTYEQAIRDFPYPIVVPIWLNYIQTFTKLYGDAKPLRIRELFESAIISATATITATSHQYIRMYYLLYAHYEQKYGTPRRLLQVLYRATQAVQSQDKLLMFAVYLVKLAENQGLVACRTVFQQSLEQLPEEQVPILALKFIKLEIKLNQIQRARDIYVYVAKLVDPTDNNMLLSITDVVSPDGTDNDNNNEHNKRFNKLKQQQLQHDRGNYFWHSFQKFEAKYGTVDTFKQFRSLQREVQRHFTETQVLRRALKAQKAKEYIMAKEKQALEEKKIRLQHQVK